MSAGTLPGPALLFCPADRPERYRKAMTRGDAVILDLEDGVLPAGKDDARKLMARELATLDRERVIVRINQIGSRWWRADVAALLGHDIAAVMVPKATDRSELEAVAPHPAIAICETAAGVLGAESIARASNCIALLWGGEDLIADLGGRRSRREDGRYYGVVRHAQAQVLLAARAQRRVAIDGVHIDLADFEGLQREALEAADVGFSAKACLHPDHVEPIRNAFISSPERREWAFAVIDAFTRAGAGVVSYQGQMIDAPLIQQARSIVDAADGVPRSAREADQK